MSREFEFRLDSKYSLLSIILLDGEPHAVIKERKELHVPDPNHYKIIPLKGRAIEHKPARQLFIDRSPEVKISDDFEQALWLDNLVPPNIHTRGRIRLVTTLGEYLIVRVK